MKRRGLYNVIKRLSGEPSKPAAHGPLTVEAVRLAVEALQVHVKSGDDEAHHSDHDDIMAGVLKAIAAGECEDPAECAKLALAPFSNDMTWWYA